MSIVQYKPNRSEDDGCFCRSAARDVHQYDVKRAQRGDAYKRVSARQATSIAKWAKEIIIDVCQKNRTHNRKIVFEYIRKLYFTLFKEAHSIQKLPISFIMVV